MTKPIVNVLCELIELLSKNSTMSERNAVISQTSANPCAKVNQTTMLTEVFEVIRFLETRTLRGQRKISPALENLAQLVLQMDRVVRCPS